MEAQRQCMVCGKIFAAHHHRARYCEECCQGIVDGTLPASASTRWRIRHPEKFTAIRRTIAERKKKPKPPRKTTRKQEPRPDYQHDYYERVTKPKRAAQKWRSLTDDEIHLMQTVWINKQID